ncbi:MAG: damage-inducible protein CinA [Archangium gephyra]|uniref:CinA-like protein n=1 Tax=Archangium gephyra TaxID=48 RepID=A0A2W5T9M1_9BACT|nr:MAG: damage-inducible protein CinA [Archangium gephyra]
MRIETICTGDELLTGLTSDTNSRSFQSELLDRTGLTVRRSVVVGDDRDDIIEALNAAAERCDVVLVSGGLGPTTDDLTAECAAKAAGVPLVESAEAYAHLVDRFRQRGMTLTDNNRRQAQVPQGSEVVLNAEGTAPMFVQRRGTCVFFYVPGVPREYRHLVGAHVVPRIAAMAKNTDVRKLALLKVINFPESHLDAAIRPLIPQHPSVTFGYRTRPPENHLKVLAVGSTDDEARRALDAAVAAALPLLGERLFARDDETMAGAVLRLLREKKQYLALAESCTGGLMASLLTAESGASASFYGAAVTYLEEAKTRWAQVPEGLLGQFGAVSTECAEAMASGVRTSTGATWGLSTTGWAGPTGGDAQNPVGTVYVGLAGPGVSRVEKHRFHGDRERVKSFAAYTALDLLRRTLEGATS